MIFVQVLDARSVWETVEIPQLQHVLLGPGPADSTCAVCVKTAETPHLHASYSFLDNVVDIPVVFNDRCWC